MTINVGIFEQEDQVLEGIRALQEAGAKGSEIRVVVGNREDVPMLAASPDVNLEEAYEIQAARLEDTGEAWVPGVAPISAYPAGNLTAGNGTPGVAVVVDEDRGEAGTEGTLVAIGIPGRLSKRCARAVDSGRIVLAVEAGNEIDARRILERAGAAVPDSD
ncbi:hypothetical protein [Cohnella hongkongensis]|uniref:General stress protein 17M-like domain-containing protein n=1 Tax=Cohnella hongkongensis TaxID=178337 RepID=A0ABV9FGE7_9BACL